MVERNIRTSQQNGKARAGAAILTLGTVLMFAMVTVAAAGLVRFLGTLGIDALGAPVAAALAALRFLQALAFHPAALLPFAYGILVLFIALAGILAGLILLRNRTVENA
jgi:hypothetical protein